MSDNEETAYCFLPVIWPRPRGHLSLNLSFYAT